MRRRVQVCLPEYIETVIGSPDHPATFVSWMNAIAFCKWLTLNAGMSTEDDCYQNLRIEEVQGRRRLRLDYHPERRGYRLPTDAEWEYACRGGTSTSFYFGSDIGQLTNYAWVLHNAKTWSQPVAQLRPCGRGLFDMYGNAYEWCYDLHERSPEGGIDPMGPSEGRAHRVLRGGSFRSTDAEISSHHRTYGSEDDIVLFIGFRLARTIEVDP